MIDFFRDIPDNPLLLTGLFAGLLAAVACGVAGPYIVARRMVFLAGAVAHIAIGGVGAAFYLAHTFPSAFAWLSPLHGALAAALLGAGAISVVERASRQSLDAVVGAMWAVGMSAGVILIKLTPGYQGELMTYLFGNITAVARTDLLFIAALCAVLVAAALLCHKRFFAFSLDEEHAELQGVDPARTNALLLVITALTVVALMQVVGLILVLALLTLPVSAVALHAGRMGSIIIASVALGALLATVPRIAVYGSAVSPEPAIVLSAAGVYLVSLVAAKARRKGWLSGRQESPRSPGR